MKILNPYKSFFWIIPAIIFSTITSCKKGLKEEKTDHAGQVEFTDVGPTNKVLGENIWIIGKNLDKVSAVKLPGVKQPITNFISKTGEKIIITAPKSTTAGAVVLDTPNGEVMSKEAINFYVIFTVSNITKEVKAGNTITIRGEYLNWIKEVWLANKIKVTNFVSQSVNELVIKIPLDAQTGVLKIIGGGTKPMTYLSKDDLTITDSDRRKDFVYSQGEKLYLNGQEWIAHGASLYPTGANSNYKDLGFKDYMKSTLDLAIFDKFTTVRVVNFIEGVTTNPYDATVWASVDYLISEAASHKLKVILDLSTFRNYLLRDKGKMPYNYADWKDMIDFVGKRYKDNSTVWLYSLAGEAEAPRAGDAAHIALRPTTQQLITFYKETSNALNAIAPDQLISCGGFIFLDYDSGIDWQSIFALPNIHLPAVHVYGDGMKSIIPTISAWTKQHNKPLFIEEFGKEKTAPDHDIAAYFQEIYTITKTNNLVGACFWNYGPQTNNDSFDMNNASTPLTITTIKTNSPLP
ncbi:MAG: cellulase family glycosylhydrolase [Sphingobacteriaceae bacterium]